MAETKAPKTKPALDPESESWNKLPWRKLEQHVYRIQKRIFKAKQQGDTRAVHTLQKLLMKSRAARLLAVRRVTQENQGKNTWLRIRSMGLGSYSPSNNSCAPDGALLSIISRLLAASLPPERDIDSLEW